MEFIWLTVLQTVQEAKHQRLLLVRPQKAYSHGGRQRGRRYVTWRERWLGSFKQPALLLTNEQKFTDCCGEPFIRDPPPPPSPPPPRDTNTSLGSISNTGESRFSMRFGGDRYSNCVSILTELLLYFTGYFKLSFFGFISACSC